MTGILLDNISEELATLLMDPAKLKNRSIYGSEDISSTATRRSDDIFKGDLLTGYDRMPQLTLGNNKLNLTTFHDKYGRALTIDIMETLILVEITTPGLVRCKILERQDQTLLIEAVAAGYIEVFHLNKDNEDLLKMAAINTNGRVLNILTGPIIPRRFLEDTDDATSTDTQFIEQLEQCIV